MTVTTTETMLTTDAGAPKRLSSSKRLMKSRYPLWFLLPGGLLMIVVFVVPTLSSFYFSLTRWTLFEADFIGLDNFVTFFRDPQLLGSFRNTFVYAIITSVGKVVTGLALAVLLTGPILGRGYLRAVMFFPVLVSAVGIGITFKVLLNPIDGLVNTTLGFFGLPGPGWLTDPSLALISVALVDVWKGVGVSTLIFMAGLVAIPRDYYEAARIDGASSWRLFRSITLPLVRPAMTTVVLLNVIAGLRSFELIWTMTGGGPGFTSDVLGSVIYKQYAAGFYGLSTAGNVVLFLVVALITVPMQIRFRRREVQQ
ncbi:ABC transporter permease [Microbacterium murale]|uniref:ABC transporter permease n=2 Tax=Microbacterium murale TaxID=1081040 RepID=A0ABQ1RY59_9MICO|nr:ABC transporter permease [Microbacterium murale]